MLQVYAVLIFLATTMCEQGTAAVAVQVCQMLSSKKKLLKCLKPHYRVSFSRQLRKKLKMSSPWAKVEISKATYYNAN